MRVDVGKQIKDSLEGKKIRTRHGVGEIIVAQIGSDSEVRDSKGVEVKVRYPDGSEFWEYPRPFDSDWDIVEEN